MNARQMAQKLLLLAMGHPDEEVEVTVYPDSYDAETAYSPELYMIELVERTYAGRTWHEIHIKP